MGPFPSPLIHSDRLELRQSTQDDLGLASDLIAAGEGEALPPGTPTNPQQLARWFDQGMYRRDRDSSVHLMMLDRASGGIVGSIGLFNADWEVGSAEVGYGVRRSARSQGYATEALVAVARWALTE